MLSPRHIGSYVALGLVLVLILLAGFTSWAGMMTQSFTEQSRNALALSSQYQDARFFLSEEVRLQNDYLLTPRSEFSTAFESAQQLMIQALIRIKHTEDSANINGIIVLHGQFSQLIQDEFSAVGGNNKQLVLAVQQKIDPLLTEMTYDITTAAEQHVQDALNLLIKLDSVQGTLMVATPIVFAIGLILSLFMIYSLQRTQRRLKTSMLHEIDLLQKSALIDHLTQLGNHRAFQDALSSELGNLTPATDALILAVVDVDEFKQCNDRFGHSYGDYILTVISMALVKCDERLRPYRIGGDEFAVIVRGMTSAEAYQTFDDFREQIHLQIPSLSVSIGLALATNDTTNTLLCEQADAAAYAAKRHGRNAVMSFADIEDHTEILTSAQTQALHRLIEEGNIQIFFQPIWDVAQDRVLAYEALMRPDPGYGFAGPQEVFDIAEHTGHAHELDRVCREAIFARANELPPDALLFINVSPQTLDHHIIDGASLRAAIDAVGLTPDRIVLEITERSLARPEVVVEEAKRLRSMGFRLALDDTGAGNAGLEMLSQLTVDFIKIDKSVIVHAPEEMAARAVLSGILAIAHTMNSYVIAEGIEDQTMYDSLTQMRSSGGKRSINGIQGYFIGRPSPTFVEIAAKQRVA